MLTVLGESVIDLVAQPDGASFVAHAGGSSLNVAVGAARLGCDVALLARLPSGAFGPVVRGHAERSGLRLDACPAAAEQASLAVVTTDAQGKPHFDFYLEGTADWQWTAAELADVPTGTTILHFGSIAAARSPGRVPVADLVRRLRASGDVLLSFDPNVRPAVMDTDAPAAIEDLASLAHVVKVSDDDLDWLHPGVSVEDVAHRWRAGGASLVVVTRGAQGALAVLPSGSVITRPAPVVEVVDTVGAGDTVSAALLTGLENAGVASVSGLVALSDDACVALIDDALLAASMTCSVAGPNPPNAEQLRLRRDAAHAADTPSG